MKSMLRIAVLLLGCAPLALAAPPASAQSAPSVTVIPDSGLVGGQVITVDGSGFAPSSIVAMCQGRLTPNPTQSDCAGAGYSEVQTDVTGAFSVPFNLARFITPASTHTTLDCAQSVQCGVGAAEATVPLGTVAVAPLKFAPQPPATFAMKGEVTGPGGNPLGGVGVWAYTPSDTWVGSLQTVTDANGNYQLDINPAVSYVVRYNPPAGTDLIAQWYDFQTHRKNGDPATLGAAFVDPVVTLQTQQLDAGGAIAGVVTDSSGAAVSNATVWAYGPGDTWVGSFGATTAADGSYRMAGVRPANYKVRFMPPNQSGLAIQWYDNATSAASAKAVTVRSGSTTTGVDDQLSPNS